MPGTYPNVRAALTRQVEELDALLSSITDDQLHNLVNQASKAAAQARARIDTIDAATQRGRR